MQKIPARILTLGFVDVLYSCHQGVLVSKQYLIALPSCQVSDTPTLVPHEQIPIGKPGERMRRYFRKILVLTWPRSIQDTPLLDEVLVWPLNPHIIDSWCGQW
jgi:hypothetical protein